MTTEVKIPNKQEVMDYQWATLSALVGGYVSKNRSGELTAWGMLMDAHDMRGDESIRYEVIENRLDLRTAVEKLDCGATLIGLACDMFIKKEDK